MKANSIRTILAAFCAIMLSACAGGTLYRDIQKSGALAPRNGNGMVIMYWKPPSMRVAGPSEPGALIYANNVILPGRLPLGGFYSHETAPGTLNVAFSMEAGESTAQTKTGAFLQSGGAGVMIDLAGHRKFGVDVNVLPGQTNYIKLPRFISMHSRATEVSKEQAERDIQKCRWANPPSNGT